TATAGAARRAPAAAPFLASVGFVMGSRAYVLMLIGATFMGANIWAAGAWSPTFLARVHHMTMTQVADALGPTRGLLGLVGILGGGILIDRLGRHDARWRLRVPAIACLLVGPSEFLFLMGSSTPAWLAGFAGTTLLSLLHQPPAFAAAMNVARPRMRALSVAMMLLFATLFGQVIGPAMVGLLTDLLTPAYGPMAIRYSMLLIAVTPVLAGLCFWAASRFLEADTARAEGADLAR
ncbi:MAG TPA: hypothetical protein VFH92_08225, partial [Phenylobacterium sp.]|nr:hypothetical protein [Phenylobacterium sp.]